jgi:hypothetical protein
MATVKRERLNRRGRRSNKKLVSGQSAGLASPERWAIFGPPQLLEGEDAAAYDELLARVCTAVKPVDMIEEMFVVDVVSLEWELLRWRRLKLSMLRGLRLHALEHFLGEHLDYLASEFAEVLRGILPEQQADAAEDLADKCCSEEPDAVERVGKLLGEIGSDIDKVVTEGRKRKAEILVREYERGEPDAVKQVNELLADHGESLDRLTAVNLVKDDADDSLNYIERIDRLTTIAEGRRNAGLREIDRRRAVLGAALRRNVHEIEEAEYKVIEPSVGGKTPFDE